MGIHVFGVRHHGPGCARSLRAALESLEPDIVLVEGPPDAQAALSLLAREEMRPPVALLIYAPDAPRSAVYYPFTHFSPEWQALHYALKRDIPARFMDLPQAFQLGKESESESQPEAAADPPAPTAEQDAQPEPAPEAAQLPLDDPLAMLAIAAGYTDHELWWERQIEQRRDITNLFEGILEAMTALRADITPKNTYEAQREAHMRQTIRTAQREGFQRIAVVCGAWHSPVLTDPAAHSAKADATLLSGLKKTKVEATWIPWTNSRLSYRSGYGAGVTSPGWYEHLWTTSDRVTIRWIANAAHLLRKQGMDTSSASVIEAVRLSEALAAMRDLPMPGLGELHESIETVLCNGNAEPMQLIREQLEIGERLGEVPPETPTVPLQRDLEAKQRRLSLKPSTEIVTKDLNLRNETDHARSQLLHQLRLLGIHWGKLQRTPGGKRGTFHEFWQLQWQVDFVISLIEANIWGNTIEVAASAFACNRADALEELPPLTDLLNLTILAELPDAIAHLLTRVQARAAVSADVRHMMDALPALAYIARYGNVRKTDSEQVTAVIDGLFERIVVGLPGACASLDDKAAQAMVTSINHTQESLDRLNRDEQQQEWQTTLRALSGRENIHGLVRGRCCRLLLEQQVLSEDELQRLARLALSPVTPAPQAAAWVEGVVKGSGSLLLHQDELWRALDSWLQELPGDDFVALLPLLRRGFSDFQSRDRHTMGEKVKHLYRPRPASAGHAGTLQEPTQPLDHERASRVLPVLAQILEVPLNGNR